MSRIFIVYHSETGNTELMAKAIYDGAIAAGAIVTLKKAIDADAEDILDCDIVVFGTPNYFHYMAGGMKEFFDRVWTTIGYQNNKKLYTMFSSAGSGQMEAFDSIEHICDIFTKWKKVTFEQVLPGIVATGKPSKIVLQKCQETGVKLAQL